MTDNVPILFVLGPSGAGKTTLGEWVEEDLHFLWIELDRWMESDGVDQANLRPEWNELMDRCQAGAIAKSLRAQVLEKSDRGAILTFSSRLVFSTSQLASLEHAGIRVLVLYGSQEDCLAAFLKREQESGRNLPKEHWLGNNLDTHERLGDPIYERYRLQVFQAGRFLDRATLMAAVKKHIG